MNQNIGISDEFKKKLLSVCRDNTEVDFLQKAFKTNDFRCVDDFLVEGAAADIPVFGKDVSAEDMLRRLDEGNVDALIKDVKDFHAYLKADDISSEHKDFRLLGKVADMITALGMAKDHEGAHIHLCKYLEDISRFEKKRDFHAELKESGYVYGS